MTSSLQSFSLSVLKWQKDFHLENLDNILRDLEKDKVQKSLAVSFTVENDTEIVEIDTEIIF